MFTGLIRECAEILEFNNNILTLKAVHKPKIGDSIAINGACLTVISVEDNLFKVELSHESRNILALENLHNKVHIEPSLTLQDGLEGHLVQGHIDALGKLVKITKTENSTDFYVDIPNNIRRFMVTKGSVAIDGVSLTINDLTEENMRLTIIAHTMRTTLFHTYKVGRRVNIESDMIARYLSELNRKTTDERDKISRFAALY